MDMLTIEVTTCLVVTLLLTATPAVADAARELVRCELEAEHLYPAPNNKVSRIGQNGKPTYGNGPRILKRACGQLVIASRQNVLLPSRPSCMKIADELMHGPSGNLYRDTDWNRICLDNEWDVRTQERLSAMLSVRQLVAPLAWSVNRRATAPGSSGS